MTDAAPQPEFTEPIENPEALPTPDIPEQVIKTPLKHQWHGPDGTKKFKPGAKMRAAIVEVLARKRMGWKPEYKVVCARHGLKSWNSLETLCRKYEKGQIDLEDSPTLADRKEIDLRGELERTLRILTKYEHHMNDVLESLLNKSIKESREGNALAFDQLGMPKVVAQLAATANLRNVKEKGVMMILEKLIELQRQKEETDRRIAAAGNELKEMGPIVELPHGRDGASGYRSHERSIAEILGQQAEGEPGA